MLGSPVIDIKTKILGDGVAFNAIGNITQAKHLAHKTGFSSTYNSGKFDLYGKYYYRRNNASEVLIMINRYWLIPFGIKSNILKA